MASCPKSHDDTVEAVCGAEMRTRFDAGKPIKTGRAISFAVRGKATALFPEGCVCITTVTLVGNGALLSHSLFIRRQIIVQPSSRRCLTPSIAKRLSHHRIDLTRLS